ncbi:MAG: hypothetical protein ABSF14_10400 [Terriglobia bacterium]|jgi:hypothetical protein
MRTISIAAQVMAHRETQQFGPIANPELSVNVCELVSDRDFAETDLLRYVPCTLSVNNRCHQFKFAWVQAENVVAVVLRSKVETMVERANEEGHPISFQPILTRHDRPNALEKEVRRCRLKCHAARAQAEGFDQLLIIDGINQQERPRRRGSFADFTQGVETGAPREFQFEQNDLRPHFPNHRDGLNTIPSLRDHLETRFGPQQSLYCCPEHSMAIGDYYAHDSIVPTGLSSMGKRGHSFTSLQTKGVGQRRTASRHEEED